MTKQASTEHREDYLQLNQYKLMGMVGQGSYSIVKMAYNMDEDTHYVRFNMTPIICIRSREKLRLTYIRYRHWGTQTTETSDVSIMLSYRGAK